MPLQFFLLRHAVKAGPLDPRTPGLRGPLRPSNQKDLNTEGDTPTQNQVFVDVFQKYLLIYAPDLILSGPWPSPLPVEMANLYIDLYNVDVLGFNSL